jgi:DNA adenine methylase
MTKTKMIKYSCEQCKKDFSQKSQYDSHIKRKTPCKNTINTIKELIIVDADNLIVDVDENKVNMNQISNISPLRYPGGKTRACKKLETIMNEHFNISNFNNLVSPFFGGGSFEFYIQNNYQLTIVANDKFTPLYNFWNICKNDNENLCKELTTKINLINKEEFTYLREQIIKENNKLNQSIMYFIINRCSFSGATLSGGFSLEASKKRFTQSSIDRIKNLNLTMYHIYNLDFEDFINTNQNTKNLIFLDPPYYLEKSSTLYGNNGDMHDTFDHNRLYNCLSTKKNWFMTYNNCKYITNLYKNFKIIETSWSYGMNASKKSSEIVIIGG